MRYLFNSTPNEGALRDGDRTDVQRHTRTSCSAPGQRDFAKRGPRSHHGREGPVEAESTFETGPHREIDRHAREDGEARRQLRYDLDGIAAAATGAGLVFICNPNNPTATVHGAKAITACVEKIRKASPDTVILTDVGVSRLRHRSVGATAVPLRCRRRTPVSRTLSKATAWRGCGSATRSGCPTR
jgi:hypothetical protein